MRRALAWLAVAACAASTVAAFTAPWPFLVPLAALPVATLRRGRAAYLAGLLFALAFQSAFVGAFAGGGPGWLGFSERGVRLGLVAGLRLGAAVGGNLAILSLAGAPRLVEGLGLPRRPTAFLAAVALCVQDLRTEAQLRFDALRGEGAWPASWRGRLAAAASLLPALLVAALVAGRRRTEALRLAGIEVGARFGETVAVTAAAAAGRLPLVAVPNVALTYVVAFAAGAWFGWRTALAGAMLGMAVTNVLITGLAPVPFVNVPAMGLVALTGAACRRVDLGGRPGALLAGAVGLLATLAFSASSDTLEWLLVREAQAAPLAARILAGLAFNVPAAAANALLFAAAAGPLTRARAAFAAPRPPPTR